MEATTVRQHSFLERRFAIGERGSSVRVELLGAVYYASDRLSAHVF